MTDSRPPAETPLRVLIVEDETLIRWAVAEALTAAGHAVLEAPDAATALRIVDEAPEPMDAVVLDLRLPDSSDLSLLAAIRRQHAVQRRRDDDGTRHARGCRREPGPWGPSTSWRNPSTSNDWSGW